MVQRSDIPTVSRRDRIHSASIRRNIEQLATDSNAKLYRRLCGQPLPHRSACPTAPYITPEANRRPTVNLYPKPKVLQQHVSLWIIAMIPTPLRHCCTALCILGAVTVAGCASVPSNATGSLSLIPAPTYANWGRGFFKLRNGTPLVVSNTRILVASRIPSGLERGAHILHPLLIRYPFTAQREYIPNLLIIDTPSKRHKTSQKHSGT